MLWSPASPHLYQVTLDASAGPVASGALRTVAHYTLESGIRAITVTGGQLYLNFQPLHVRGVGLIEDSPTAGSALSPAQQLALITAAKTLGATMIRSQYPLSAYEEQLADEQGIMLWSEIPAYQVPDPELRAVIPSAVSLIRQNILDNGNHPSIVIWSVGNELDPLVGPAETAYIAATVAAAHELDPTRPVGLAYEGYPAVGCQAGYGPLDVLGINDYFGWYPGPGGQIADPSLLPDYLAQERACYPKQALMVTEFGAEADRDGPIDERGTYQFQTQFATSQLNALTATPWLSGAIWWALQDFEVRPGWTGGNPYPMPPLFSKGLLDFSGQPKPAFAAVRAALPRHHADRVGGEGAGSVPSRAAWQPATSHASTSRAAPPRGRARRGACATRGSCRASSTAAPTGRSASPSTRACCARRSPPPARCSSSRSTASARPRRSSRRRSVTWSAGR